MIFSFQNIAIAVALIAAPSTLWTAFTRYSEWAANMRGSKTIQVIALLSVVALIALDAVDRLGILWPSPSEVAQTLKTTRESVDRQAKMIDGLRDQLAATTAQLNTALSQRGITGSGSVEPMTVADPKDCPPGYLIIANSELDNASHAGILTNDKHICVVGTRMRGNKTNIELHTR